MAECKRRNEIRLFKITYTCLTSTFFCFPLGSKTRKIPYPTKNPFTWIFLLVSCPNYTYEVTREPICCVDILDRNRSIKPHDILIHTNFSKGCIFSNERDRTSVSQTPLAALLWFACVTPLSLLLQLGAWLGFTLMTQCLPVAFFTLVGFIQMTVWAKGKHRSYLKEFRDYPPLRSPILPFIL